MPIADLIQVHVSDPVLLADPVANTSPQELARLSVLFLTRRTEGHKCSFGPYISVNYSTNQATWIDDSKYDDLDVFLG